MVRVLDEDKAVIYYKIKIQFVQMITCLLFWALARLRGRFTRDTRVACLH